MPSHASTQTENTLLHHLHAIGAGDIDAIMKDYAEEAVLCTPEGMLRGPDQIRPMFEMVVTKVLPPGSTVKIVRQIVEGDLAYVVWSAESASYTIPLGTDTFVMREGKIVTQTFAAQLEAVAGRERR